LDDIVDPFRVMDDPVQSDNPEMYKGERWIDGAGVHTNSSVGNLFYVILSDGRTGVNQKGDAFEVEGIGEEDASKFIFYINRNYLTETSSYQDYYEACMVGADIYFGGDQDKLNDVSEAWKAVGLPYETSTGDDSYDLVIDSEGFVRTCDWGGLAPLSFTVENVGSIPYDPSEEGFVRISTNLVTGFVRRDFPLDSIIMPGESKTWQVEPFIELIEETIFIDYELRTDDADNGNETFDFIRVSRHNENDLEIEIEQISQKCFSDDYTFNLSISNRTCTSLSEGTSLGLMITDRGGSEVYWSEELILENNLFPNASERLEQVVTIEGLDGFEEFSVQLDFSEDRDNLNNRSVSNIEVLDAIEGEYFNGFDRISDLSKQLQVNAQGSSDPSYFYEGETLFVTTGGFEDPNDPLCVEKERNWEGTPDDFFSPISAEVITCLDFEGEHDVIQEHVIQGLEEGDKESQIIPIPDNFKGQLKMQCLTHTGSSLGASDYLDYDVLMMDNLIITGQSSTQETTKAAAKFYPNPTSGRINIITGKDIKTLSLIGVDGLPVVNRFDLGNKVELDLNRMPAGFYICHMMLDDGQHISETVIKVGN